MGRAGGREGRKGVERSAAQGLEAPPRLSMRAAGPVERLRDGQRDRRLEPPRINTEVQLRVLSSTRLNMVTQFKFRPLTQAHYPPGTSGTDSGADNH